MENDQAKEWIADAIGYMFDLRLFTQDEINPSFSAKDAVDEEMRYWGD